MSHAIVTLCPQLNANYLFTAWWGDWRINPEMESLMISTQDLSAHQIGPLVIMPPTLFKEGIFRVYLLKGRALLKVNQIKSRYWYAFIH